MTASGALSASAMDTQGDEGVALVPGEVLALSRGVVELKRGPRQVFHFGVGKARQNRAGRRILADLGAIVKQNWQ